MIHQKLDSTATHSTWLILLMFPISALLIAYAPDSWGYENGPIENTQLIFLMLSILFCVTAKEQKNLYLFCATVILFLLFREINCGRVLLWSRNGTIFHSGPPQDYLKWKEIPHGPAIRIGIYTLLSLLCLIALLRARTYKNIFTLITRNTWPIWELLFILIGICTSILMEKLNLCFIAEEMGETLMYAAFTSAVYRFTRAKQHPTPLKN